MCCSLVSSTSGRKTLLGIRMHQGGAGILVCNTDLGVGDFLETDAGFVGVEVGGCACVQLLLLPRRTLRYL